MTFGTVIVLLILCTVVGLIIAGMVKDRKKGVSSCGCGCKSCPNSGMCHTSDKTVKK